MTDISTSIRELKKRSREVLFASYSKLLFATVLYIALSAGFFYLSNCFAGLLYGNASENTVTLVAVTFSILAILLCTPLFFGYASLVIRVCRGEECSIADVFYFYSSGACAKAAFSSALSLCTVFAASVLIPAVIVPGGYTLIKDIAESFLSDLNGYEILLASLNVLYFIPAVILIAVSFFLFGDVTARFIMQSVPETARTPARFKRKDFFILRLSMLPLYIISVLSFGILFIVYTVPFTLTAYTLFLGLDKKDAEPSGRENGTADMRQFESGGLRSFIEEIRSGRMSEEKDGGEIFVSYIPDEEISEDGSGESAGALEGEEDVQIFPEAKAAEQKEQQKEQYEKDTAGTAVFDITKFKESNSDINSGKSFENNSENN